MSVPLRRLGEGGHSFPNPAVQQSGAPPACTSRPPAQACYRPWTRPGDSPFSKAPGNWWMGRWAEGTLQGHRQAAWPPLFLSIRLSAPGRMSESIPISMECAIKSPFTFHVDFPPPQSAMEPTESSGSIPTEAPRPLNSVTLCAPGSLLSCTFSPET